MASSSENRVGQSAATTTTNGTDNGSSPRNDNNIVCVLGAGSYGTALVFVAAAAGRRVHWWMRDVAQCESINSKRVNSKRFSDTPIPSGVTAFTDLDSAVEGASIVLHAIPAQHTTSFLKKYAKSMPSVPYVSTAKGISEGRLMSEVLPECFPSSMHSNLAYLSGPSFAKEMIAGHPVAVVVAAEMAVTRNAVREAFSCPHFRIYDTSDV